MKSYPEEVRRRVWLAVDVSTKSEAEGVAGRLAKYVDNIKVGLEFTTAVGAPEAVRFMRHLGFKNIWLDGKFHDIPNTVAGAARAAAGLGVSMFTVHAGCGRDAMREAVKYKGDAKVLAVTVLTSLSGEDLRRMGYPYAIADHPQRIVDDMVQTAFDAGVDGIVCSPRELDGLDAIPEFKHLLKVTPGVRPIWASAGDQKRIMTPGDAIRAGASALVIGRPLTNPPTGITYREAVERIYDDIQSALNEQNEGEEA